MRSLIDYNKLFNLIRETVEAGAGESPTGLVNGKQAEHMVLTSLPSDGAGFSMADSDRAVFDLVSSKWGYEVKTTTELRVKDGKVKLPFKRFLAKDWTTSNPADYFEAIESKMQATGRKPAAMIVLVYHEKDNAKRGINRGDYQVSIYDYSKVIEWLKSLNWEKHGSWIGSENGGRRGEAVWQKNGLMSIKLPTSLILQQSEVINVLD